MDTVKTPAFCNLPKDALVKLISSDYLGLEEEDVWRAVLNWAKYQVIYIDQLLFCNEKTKFKYIFTPFHYKIINILVNEKTV